MFRVTNSPVPIVSTHMGDFDWTGMLTDVGTGLVTATKSTVEQEGQKLINKEVQKLLGTGEKAVKNNDGTVTIIKETTVPQTVVQTQPMSKAMKIGLGVGGVMIFGLFTLLIVKTMKSK